jgi:hypothetical protein
MSFRIGARLARFLDRVSQPFDLRALAGFDVGHVLLLHVCEERRVIRRESTVSPSLARVSPGSARAVCFLGKEL